MSCPFNDAQLSQLKVFVDLCKAQPQILHHPKLSFFKDYLTSFGVTLPTATFETKDFTASGDRSTKDNKPEAKSESSSDEEMEYDVELDLEGVIESEPLNGEQVMGDDAKEVTDEERDQSDEKRTSAMKAFSEQQFDVAITLYTEAIVLNPQSALLFAKRGQVYLKLNKLDACIKDCTKALELNCDSAAAYKFRGRAYRLLGKFEEASHDLCESLKIDYDDQTNEWLQEVKPNAEKLRQHKLSVQRQKEESEHRERLRRARKVQEAHAQAEAQFKSPWEDRVPLNTPREYQDYFKVLMEDPEICASFEDPEVMKAFMDVSKNPANYVKHMSNPKVAAFLEKMKNISGQVNNDTPGFPGSAAPPHSGAKPSTDDDVGLD